MTYGLYDSSVSVPTTLNSLAVNAGRAAKIWSPNLGLLSAIVVHIEEIKRMEVPRKEPGEASHQFSVSPDKWRGVDGASLTLEA